jgi:carbonic anhydrase
MQRPSAAPTDLPTRAPVLQPTRAPTARPVVLPPIKTEPHGIGDRGYFNYDPSSKYGPPKWDAVELVQDSYWKEFSANGFGVWKGVLQQKLEVNMCLRGPKQSPIDVRSSGFECAEYHEIRENAGEFNMDDGEVKKSIEYNKLRLVYPRRTCPDVEDAKCRNYDLPLADFPNRWPKTADVLHIDFKIPAEHSIRGEAFAAEMQIFHLHHVKRRVAVLSTMVRVGAFNPVLQEALDAFQRLYNANQAICALQRNSATKNIEPYTLVTISTEWDSASPVSEQSFNGTRLDDNGQRHLKHIWNPYDEQLIPTIHFYRYDGSLTEPPCTEFVSWFVSDKPMAASAAQLDQWRTIQFSNVHPNTCRPTSVDYDRSVARPLQKPNNRDVWQCTPSDFGPDP